MFCSVLLQDLGPGQLGQSGRRNSAVFSVAANGNCSFSRVEKNEERWDGKNEWPAREWENEEM